MNGVISKETKPLCKHISNIERPLQTFDKVVQAVSRIKKATLRWQNDVVHLVKWHCGFNFYLSQHPTSYLVKKLKEKVFKLSWPLKIPRLIILPLFISASNLKKQNKIENLASIIHFLWINQCYFDKRLISKTFSKCSNQTSETKYFFCKPILKADLKNIYNKLKRSEIIQKKKMKVDTKKSLLLYEDYKIIRLFSDIATSILNYFSCCDNFFKIKPIIYFFIRFSLATTIMQKHSMPSAYQVFKEYGENLRVIHPRDKSRRISFLTKNEIHNWPKGF